MRLALCSVLLTLILLGCGGDNSNEPKPQSAIAGNWVANVPTPPLSYVTFGFSLSEAAGVVQGSGVVVSFPSDSIPIDIEGTYDEPEVSLTITGFGAESIQFEGIVSDTTMEGNLNSSYFMNEDVTFHRRDE